MNKKRTSMITATGRAVETLESRWLMAATLTLDHSLMVFNAVKNNNSPIETLTLTNTGDANLTFGGGAIAVVNDSSAPTADAARFTIVNSAAIPAALTPGQSFSLQLQYKPNAVTRNAALLDISSNDPAHALQEVQLHGIGTNGTGGTNQPSLARILRAYNIPTIVGEGPNDSAEATSAIYPTPPDASSEELDLQRLVKAGAGPVTIEVLASFTADGAKPYTLGIYAPGQPTSRQELFFTPTTESQTVFVHPQGATNFDPGSKAFGFYFVSNVQVVGRIGYSEDALNTFDTTVPRKFRFFPMKNADGSVVPNAFVMTSTEWDAPSGYDFTNIVAIVRNVMAAPSSPAAPVIGTQDLFALPGSSNMIFNRIQIPNATVGDSVHDTGTLRITNTGGSNLIISSAQISSVWTILNQTFPVTIAPGGLLDLTIKFIAQSVPSHAYNQTGSPSFPNSGGVHSGTLKLNSNDPNNPVQTINLAGYWQNRSENENEPSLQTVINLLAGWGTNINDTPIPNLTENGSVAKYYGEETVSAYWLRADTSRNVSISQIDGFHTEGNTASTWWHSMGSTSLHTLFTTASTYGQTLFPVKSGGGTNPATASFNPANTPFGFKVDAEWTDDTKNNASGGGHHIRFYPVRDATGALLPGVYIMAMDYSVNATQNFDFQDNLYVVSNIRPAAVPASPTNFFATAGAGGVSLQWAPVPGTLAGYNIYRSLASSSGFSLVTSGVGSASYTDATAPTGTTVYYRVTAVDSSSSAESLGPVASATTLGTPASTLQSLDIGATPAGSTTVVTPDTAFTVVAGGPGVAGTADGFRFLFQQKTGNFDVRMQVSSLTVAGNFSTAGLMARGTLNTNSANVYMSASPANFRFKTRATAGGSTAVVASGTPSYPNVWVRLRRVGNVFTGFTSIDGVSWTTMSSATLSLPSTVFIGPAVASNVTTTTTTAQISNFGVTFTGPVANNDSFNATTAEPALLNVLNNDTDSTGTIDSTTVTITNAPNQGGAATVDPVTGRITYTSAAGFFGTETFTYTVTDNNGVTSPAAVVTVNVAPTGPSANPDAFNAIAGQPVQVNVLANDTDSTGTIDPASLSITQQPEQGGTVSVNAVTGLVTYKAAAGFSGSETFAYTVMDSNALTSAAATVTFTVTNAPSGPLANDDTVAAIGGQSVQIDVLANDADAGGTIDATTVALVSPPDQGGTVQIDSATGLVTYTPSPDFSGIETFTYTVKDASNRTSNTATVTANVAASATAPVASDDVSTAFLGAAVQVNVSGNDTSSAGLDLTSIAVDSAPAHGTATVNSDGTITYTPAANFLGRDSFTYTVKDVDGNESNPATVSLNVGVAVSAVGANRVLAFTDSDGTSALLALNRGVANVFFSGNGTATIVRGRVSVAGATAISSIELTGTNAASSLVLRGTGGDGVVTVPSLTAAGAVGAVLAPSARLTGTASFGGLGALQIAGAVSTTMQIGTAVPSGLVFVAGTVSDSSLSSGVTIRAMRVSSWTDSASNNTITAPAITSLLALGDFNSSLGLTGPANAALPTLGAARVVGAIASGSWNITGTTRAIVAGSVGGGWGGNFGGKLLAMAVQSGGLSSKITAGGIGSMLINGDLTGDIETSSLTGLRVTGRMFGSTLNVTGTTPVNAVLVGAAIKGSAIRTAGDIVALLAGTIEGSTVTAGVDAGTSLANVTPASIGTHTIRAIRLTSRTLPTFADSSIIARTISAALVGDVDTTNNGTPHGLAAVKFGAIALTANGVKALLGPTQLTDSTKLASVLSQKGITLGDFEIDVVT